MRSFFNVKTPEEVFEIIRQFGPIGEETVSLEEAEGRVLSKDVIAEEDLPGFPRSVMDGYAVRAKDTFGASESLPVLLEICGEVTMGQIPDMTVKQGQAIKVSTGGMLPDGADGVIMVEYCHLLDGDTLETTRAISPLENIIQPGDDFKKGATVLRKAQSLRAQDVGVMAGLGQSKLAVYRKPKIAIMSTGDEIVKIDAKPRPGQVRDINLYTLNALCLRLGAQPIPLGLIPDTFDSLKEIVENALTLADAIWISGGSSVGTRDLTLKVLESFADFELLVHGISISPGKPTIIGRIGSQAIIGLPGHVASALVIAEIFMTRLIMRLSGCCSLSKEYLNQIDAELTQNVESASGREDYIRVKLIKKDEGLFAEPVFGKSGLISTLVDADGLVRIEMNTEGLYQGQKIRVLPFVASPGGVR